MYIITENGVKTIEDCQNRKQIDNYYKYYYKADFSSLTELLQYCNYDYNACHCDTNGQKLPIDEPRCGNITNCRAGRDRPGGYICEKVRPIPCYSLHFSISRYRNIKPYIPYKLSIIRYNWCSDVLFRDLY